MVIRARRDADLDEAATALVAVHAADSYPVEGVDDPRGWLSPKGLIQAWVAEADSRIVGHVAISQAQAEEAVSLYREQAHTEAQVGVLARLFVMPQARKRAVGERLVRAAVEYAHTNDLRLVLDVMTKDKAAIRLYERMGWQSIGDASHAYGEGQQMRAVCYVSPAE
ncbi:GNAT family N-acetyltransferase [Streptomyces kanamyceticus]|uniref:GNAT family N-acetyltransferase n=1 Tax=Streptomyces kanamyceticus TaxID=1967 RepID=A0A5J6GNP9_STRKN|nr:GNAT family N-acetyltransferase [Streptomyces kanamyceticus]